MTDNEDNVQDEEEPEQLEDGVVGEGVEGEESNEVPEGRYFAMSPVVRLMKEGLDSDKMIRSRVKEEMIVWLEKTVRKITKKMNESEYTMVTLADFRTAIEPYELIEDVEGERHRIVATCEKIKQDCDSLIRDVERKFITFE